MPREFDHRIDAKIGPKFERGRWYFSNDSGFDHTDFCGVPPLMTVIKTLVGTEYRQAFWSNVYQRVMLLEIEEEIMDSDSD